MNSSTIHIDVELKLNPPKNALHPPSKQTIKSLPRRQNRCFMKGARQ
jgi:hypothetical protein